MDGFTPLDQTWPSHGKTLQDRGSASFYVIGTLKLLPGGDVVRKIDVRRKPS